MYAQVELSILKEEFWSAKPRSEIQLFEEWGLSRAPQEVGYVVAFDGMRNVRSVVEVARGSHGTMDIHVPSVLRAVLVCGGERFTFVHTHPTGNAVPSPADFESTRKIANAAAACGLILEDHLILTPKKDVYTSFVEEGIYVAPDYNEGFQVSVDREGNILGYDPLRRLA